jgi:hypothetical protein
MEGIHQPLRGVELTQRDQHPTWPSIWALVWALVPTHDTREKRLLGVRLKALQKSTIALFTSLLMAVCLVPSTGAAPALLSMWDDFSSGLSNLLGRFTRPVGNRHHLDAFDIREARHVALARDAARSDNADPNGVCH